MSLTNVLAAAGLQSVDENNNPVSTPAQPVATWQPAPEPIVPQVAPEPVEVPPAPEPPAPLSADEGEVVAQADKPDVVERLIQEERRKANEARHRIRELEAEAQRAALAAMPLEQRLQSETQRANEAEKRASQFLVAAKHNLPLDLATRLQGDSIEALEQDAQSLFAHLNLKPAVAAPPQGANGGFLPQPEVKIDPERAHGMLLAQHLRASRGA